MIKLIDLPESVQESVKDTLRAFHRTSVYRKADGTHYDTTSFVIHTGVYDEFIAEFTDAEVFTDEERILNYVNTFRSYPVEYKGLKNWPALNREWTSAHFADGNIVFSYS